MTLIYTKNVRVGVEVERHDSKWIPFTYRMFYCRTNDRDADWVKEEAEAMTSYNNKFRKLKVGERRRYWMHLCIDGYKDYWDDYCSSVGIISMKRAR